MGWAELNCGYINLICQTELFSTYLDLVFLEVTINQDAGLFRDRLVDSMSDAAKKILISQIKYCRKDAVEKATLPYYGQMGL